MYITSYLMYISICRFVDHLVRICIWHFISASPVVCMWVWSYVWPVGGEGALLAAAQLHVLLRPAVQAHSQCRATAFKSSTQPEQFFPFPSQPFPSLSPSLSPFPQSLTHSLKTWSISPLLDRPRERRGHAGTPHSTADINPSQRHYPRGTGAGHFKYRWP